MTQDQVLSLALQVAAAELQKTTGIVALPILRVVGDADIFCVRQDGTLARYDHELGELEKVDRSFFDLLDAEIGELKARTEKKKALLAGAGAS